MRLRETNARRRTYLLVSAGRWSVLVIAITWVFGAVSLSAAETKIGFNGPPATQMLPVPQTARHSLTNGRNISVVVLNSEDGSAILNALVSGTCFIGNMPETTAPSITDRAGKATIRLGEIDSRKRMEAQRFRISILAPGFAGKGLMYLNRGADPRADMPEEVVIKMARGETIGGTVLDQQRASLPGVKVKAHGSSYVWGGAAEFFEVSVGHETPPVVTDSQGRWAIRDFPKDLNQLALELIRADGSITKFANKAHGSIVEQSEFLNMSDLRKRTAAFVLKDGFTVRGVVVDPAGKPVPDALVKEGYGMDRPKVVSHFRTDSQGRFELRNRSPKEIVLTAESEFHTLGSTVVAVGSNTPIAMIIIQRREPLRIRVTDQFGKPVAGARVFPGYRDSATDGVWPRLEGMVLDFEGITDSNGIALWKNAPATNLILTAHSTTLNTWRTVPVDASAARDIRIQLRPGSEREFLIEVKATEQETGKPVVIDRVFLIPGEHENHELFSTPGRSEFTIPFLIDSRWKGPGFGGCKLRFESDGYLPVFAPEKNYRDFNAGDWALHLELRRSAKPSGWVFLEDGTPAKGAVAVATLNSGGLLHLRDGGELYRDERHVYDTADSSGFFKLQDTGNDQVVLISHQRGFLKTRTGLLRSQPRLKLEPWGKVDGVLHFGSKPDAGTRIGLRGGAPLNADEEQWVVQLTARTDTAGRFSFDEVPPGRHWLYRLHQNQSGPISPTYQLAVDVHPGQTTSIRDGGSGRTILGKVPTTYDWTRDAQLLVLAREAKVRPSWNDYASRTSFDKAMEDYHLQSGPYQNRNYTVIIEKDGTLRIHDVLPGTYELRLRISAPAKNPVEEFRGKDSTILASVTREVVIPATSSYEPIDLGELEVVTHELNVPERLPFSRD